MVNKEEYKMNFLVNPIDKKLLNIGCSTRCGSQCLGDCNNLGACFCPLKFQIQRNKILSINKI